MSKHKNPSTLMAFSMPTRELLSLVGVREKELAEAEKAFCLYGQAREVAIQGLACSHKLAAAVELGRRAWMFPSPSGRRVRTPFDVAAVVAPKLLAASDKKAETWAIALDPRLTLAKIQEVSSAIEGLKMAIAAGCSRLVLAKSRPDRAVPKTEDAEEAEELLAKCELLDVKLVDIVLLGDDGFSSLVRLGMIPLAEHRYR